MLGMLINMSTLNDKFLRNFSWPFYLLSKFFFPEVCREKIFEEISFHISFCCRYLTRGLCRGLTFNKPPQHLVHCGVAFGNKTDKIHSFRIETKSSTDTKVIINTTTKLGANKSTESDISPKRIFQSILHVRRACN